MWVERVPAKGGISLHAVFLFLLICSVSARKIYLNWGGSMAHLVDALAGKKSPSFGPSSAVSCHCHLWQVPELLWVSVSSSPEFRGFKR